MKKEISFVAIMALSGCLTGLAITAILFAIASPSLGSAILTIAEKNDLLAMARVAELISANTWFIYLPTITISFVALIFYLKVLNPYISRTTLKNRTALLKFITTILVLMAVHAILAAVEYGLGLTIKRPLMAIGSGDDVSGIPVVLAYVEAAVIGGMTWCTVGATGWAGDLSSFKVGSGSEKFRPFTCLRYGAIVGILATGLFFFFDWSFNRFFLLINEVLDETGETSMLGFKYLGFMIVSMMITCSSIFACLTLAFAPVDRGWDYRRSRLTWSAFLAGMFCLAVWGGELYSAAKYDLNKKDLNQAAGLSVSPVKSKTIVLFKPTKDNNGFVIQEWPMEVEGYSMMASNKVVLTEDNLNKVAEFINNRPGGSIYKYSAMDVLFKGYHALWKVKKGLEYQNSAAQHLMLPRMMMVARLKYLPITEQHLGYLEVFSDEKLWYVGNKAAPKIAAGFIHFNKFAAAAEWLERAIEGDSGQSDSSSNVVIPAGPVLTEGEVEGGIKVNGVVPLQIKIALFAAERLSEKIKSWDTTISLVNVSSVDQTGRFAFSNLGQGSYALAIMTESKTLPYDTSVEKVKVKNLPGRIDLGVGNPAVDLGEIEVTTE